MLGADVLVLEPVGFLLGGVGHLTEARRESGLRSALRTRELVELGTDGGREGRGIRVHLADDLRNDAFFLLDERQQQVLRLDLGMPFAVRELLRGKDRLLCFLGVFVDVHDRFQCQWPVTSSGHCRNWSLETTCFQLRQRFVMLALFLRQRARELDLHRGVQVAAVVRFPDGRHAVPFQPEHLPALGRLRDLEPDRAGDRRDLRLAAEHGGRDRHRDFRVQIGALALEDRVRLDADPEIQIAGRAAVRAGFPFAGGAHARSVPHADRDPHVDAARVSSLLDRDAARGAVVRLLERELDLVLDVAPLLRTGRPALPGPRSLARPTAAAEERLEEVRERILVPEQLVHFLFAHGAVAAGTAHVDVPGAAARARTRAPERRAAGEALALLLRLVVHLPVRAELVVLAPLLRIAEHFVCLVDLLEPRLGGLVAGVDVRMVLARKLPIRLLQLFVGSRLRDAERLVVVLEFHQLSVASGFSRTLKVPPSARSA